MPDTHTPCEVEFSDLIRALKAEALDNDAGYERATKFLLHIVSVRARWTAGDASPVRTARAKGDVA